MNSNSIKCVQAEKLITGYIDGTLTDSETTMLLSHIEKCESCKEELTIQYFISEGLQRVEESEDYNLSKSLKNKILFSKEDIKVRNNARNGFIACVVGIVLVVVTGAMMVVI